MNVGWGVCVGSGVGVDDGCGVWVAVASGIGVRVDPGVDVGREVCVAVTVRVGEGLGAGACVGVGTGVNVDAGSIVGAVVGMGVALVSGSGSRSTEHATASAAIERSRDTPSVWILLIRRIFRLFERVLGIPRKSNFRLGKFDPRGAVAAALSGLRPEVSDAAVVAQVFTDYVSERARSPPVYHPDLAQAVANGMVEKVVESNLRVVNTQTAQVEFQTVKRRGKIGLHAGGFGFGAFGIRLFDAGQPVQVNVHAHAAYRNLGVLAAFTDRDDFALEVHSSDENGVAFGKRPVRRSSATDRSGGGRLDGGQVSAYAFDSVSGGDSGGAHRFRDRPLQRSLRSLQPAIYLLKPAHDGGAGGVEHIVAAPNQVLDLLFKFTTQRFRLGSHPRCVFKISLKLMSLSLEFIQPVLEQKVLRLHEFA